MEITKREILASAAIVCIMFVLGLLIQQSIRTAVTDKNKEYELALQIKDTDTFEYAMRTNVGNAFVYGKLVAVDTVKNNELDDNEWLWIEKVKEKYTQHERIVTHTDGKKKWTTVEYYYTWDRVGSQSWHSERVNFLNKEFPYDMITNFGFGHIRTDTHGHTRYKWYASKVEHEGTIYTKLADGTITKSDLHEGKTIKETFDSMVKNPTVYLIGFWIFWVALTVGLCVGFYAMENRWLE